MLDPSFRNFNNHNLICLLVYLVNADGIIFWKDGNNAHHPYIQK
jgi:hypothetical protein